MAPITFSITFPDFDLLAFLIAALAGFFTKLADYAADAEKGKAARKPGFSGPILAAAYGVLLAAFAARVPIAFPLVLGVILAMLVCGKIDSPLHALGLASFLFVTFAIGAPSAFVPLILFFFAGALVDEVSNDYSDSELELVRQRRRYAAASRILWLKMLQARLMLDLCALAASIVLGNWNLFLALVCFDLGYKLAARLGTHKTA